jgi:acyl-CoA synthetase (AMP-forming)/AMP-acid ligase II
MTTDIVQLHAARLAACARRPLQRSMGALVNDAACRAPDLPICTFFEAGDTLMRRALDRLSNRFANGLRAIGIGRDDRVGVMLPNVREYPITWIALVKLGAAMVPINPRYTPRELQFALTDAGCAALVIDAAHLPMLTLIGAPDLRLSVKCESIFLSRDLLT